MWQRKQTLFLLLVSLLMIIGLFLPVWSKSKGEITVKSTYFLIAKIQNSSVVEKQNIIYLGLLALATSVIALFGMLKFNDRPLQLKLGLLNSFLLTLTLVVVVFSTVKGNELLPNDDNGDFLIGFYAPGLAMIMNWLANRAIRNDEKIVKDAFERIR
ncbi:MAG: DUF4293 domain-containing protein [Cytophagales bacterium]